MERTVVVVVSLIIVTVAAGVIFLMLSRMQPLFSEQRIGCAAEPLCAQLSPGSTVCERDVLITCGLDANACPVATRLQCVSGCNQTGGAASCIS